MARTVIAIDTALHAADVTGAADLNGASTMNRRLFAFQVSTAVLVVSSAVSVAHAQTPPAAWRCSGDSCQDDLMNDIEDTMESIWPGTLTFTPPSLPYTCATNPSKARQSVGGEVPWTVTISAQLPSFLLGRSTASADVVGTIQASSDGSTWPGTSVHDLFQDACTVTDGVTRCVDVGAPGADTGVSELGALQLSISGGSFWSSSLKFHLPFAASSVLWCDVGYPGHVMRVTPPWRGSSLEFSYPVAWTPVQALLEATVRDQFRQAVTMVVSSLD
jgi:hypothetical protein